MTTQQQQQQQMNIHDNNKSSLSQIEIDNAYLRQQNAHLEKELSFTRYTINALKNMTNQRDNILNETRQELERALQHIQLLTYTLKQQQRYSAGMLVNDESSDDQELSEEDEIYETNSSRPTMNIMSKLPLRHHHHSTGIQVKELEF